MIKIDRERFEAPELLFNPSKSGKECLGTSEMVFKAIDTSPIDTRKQLYANILTSGGSSMLPGFSTRLDNDIRKIYIEEKLKLAKNKKIKIRI